MVRLFVPGTPAGRVLTDLITVQIIRLPLFWWHILDIHHISYLIKHLKNWHPISISADNSPGYHIPGQVWASAGLSEPMDLYRPLRWAGSYAPSTILPVPSRYWLLYEHARLYESINMDALSILRWSVWIWLDKGKVHYFLQSVSYTAIHFV